MSHIRLVLLFFLTIQLSCIPTPVDVEADLSLDELEDKTEYTGALVIDGRYYQGDAVDKILVNGSLSPDNHVLILFAGYYRIEVFRSGSKPSDPEVIRVVILDPERGETEWGLPPWTPVNPENGNLGDQTVGLLHAPAAPANSAIPLVVILEEELGLSDSYLDATIGTSGFRIKRGVGSVQIPPGGSLPGLRIDQRDIQLDIQLMDSPPQQLSGELNGDLHVPAGSYIHIPADLFIPAGISLRIDSGTFITVAPEVNIHNDGVIIMNGTAGAPVSIICSDAEAYWGGFISHTGGNRLEASYTIFSRSGHHTGGEYAYGHAGRQALFYSENGELLLDHCYMIDHIGQVFYPLGGTLALNHCLVQRAKTGGQLNQSELQMDHCVFTDFPDDSFEYRDEDNDALYLNETNAVIRNSVFMFARDDGLDSGASGGGEVYIDRCRFEANFHEGAALSSGHSAIKLHHITNSVFTNNGQGLELGYSSPNHQVFADSCIFNHNAVGVRFGDCYDWAYRGNIHVQNSESLGNSYLDVWNMLRSQWAADTSRMSFNNVYVNKADPMYPGLIVNE
jgi:hypothetical protein